MRARSFLHVSLGIFALATAYHLGVRNAGAQAGGETLVDIAWRRADGYAYAVTTTGAIYAGPGYCQPLAHVGQMPAGCVPVCVLDGDVGGSLDIGCSDGSVWTVQGSVPSITVAPCVNVFSGPTPARQESFGGVKTRYR
jgi:hypothetical protein